MPDRPEKQIAEWAYHVAQSSSAMLAYWDKNLVCRFANKAYLDWFGLDPEGMIDKMLLKTVLGHLYEKNLVHINGALNGQPQIFERPILTPAGITKIARASYIPDVVNGTVRGFYVQVVDTTPLSNSEKELGADKFAQIPVNLSVTGQILCDVVQTLKANIFTAFPGITQLAKQHFISESKLKRDFREKYKTSIFSYYRNLQMEVAEQYINEKRCNKNQAALKFNFSNPSNFLVCYKKYLKEKETTAHIKSIKTAREDDYKTFVAQVPFEIAMFDTQLNYLAASQLWLENYHIDDGDFIGKNLYELSPGAKQKFGDMLEACLKGHINKNDAAPVERINRPLSWMRWDIRPWYTINKEIGGLIMITEDITALKIKEAENRQLIEILEKTNEIVRIGTWSRNLATKTSHYNKVLKEIFEVPEDYLPEYDGGGITFYKDEHSRLLIEKVFKVAIEHGESFDVTVGIVTAKGNPKTVRIIGYPTFANGICEKISGVYHEITLPKPTIPS